MDDLYTRTLNYWKAHPEISCASLADAKQKMLYAVADVWGMPKCETITEDECNANENTSIFWNAYLASLPPVVDLSVEPPIE